MKNSEWKINLREANITLLEALLLRVPAAPKALLRQLCKKQRVTVEGQPSDADRSVQAGERIAVKSSGRWLECLGQSRLQPDQLLYEDGHCMVINKPAGLAIHRAVGHDDNLLHRVQDFLFLRGEKFQVAPIHRLDIGTSGAVLFGKGRASISQLGQMVMAGEMTKRYLALVEASITEAGLLETAVPAKGCIKEALTRYQPVARGGNYTLLELELVTGRHHQIRHQLAEAGWPIIGDTRYYGKIINEIKRPFLHCHHLTFPSLTVKEDVGINCPLSKDLSLQLQALGFEHEALADGIID